MAVVTEPKVIDPTELSGSGQIPVERVATPKTPEEVAKMVTEALQESKTLLPLGGGRDLFTARKTFDIGISLKKLTNEYSIGILIQIYNLSLPIKEQKKNITLKKYSIANFA